MKVLKNIALASIVAVSVAGAGSALAATRVAPSSTARVYKASTINVYILRFTLPHGKVMSYHNLIQKPKLLSNHHIKFYVGGKRHNLMCPNGEEFFRAKCSKFIKWRCR